jgi:transglutaminase-like putative cysteine protease
VLDFPTPSMLPLFASLLATQLAQAPDPGAALPPSAPAPEAARWPGAGPHLRRLAAEAVQAAEAGSPWALAHLYRLHNFTHLYDADPAAAAALAKVAEARRAPPLVRDHARWLLAQRARAAGDTAGAQAAVQALGLVTAGFFAGPFDNAAGAGHATAFPPELGATLETPLIGSQGPIPWRSLDHLAPNGRIALSRLLYGAGGEACAYLAVAVEAARPTRAALRAGSSDALKAWVNGALVLDHDTRRFAALDQDAAAVELRAGLNLVLVKVSWAGEEGELLVRLTAPEGGPLAGVTLRPERAAVQEALQRFPVDPSRAPAPGKVRDLMSGLPRPEPQARRPAAQDALLADLLSVQGLFDARALPSPPEALLASAIQKAPADPELRFFFAHRVRRRDPNLARAQLEAALTADPGFAPALLALGEAARDGGRALEARAHLARAAAADPDFELVATTRAALGFEVLEEGALALRRLLAAPGAERWRARRQAATLRKVLGDAAGARADAEAVLAVRADDDLARSMAVELALDARDPERALALVAAGLAQSPDLLNLRLLEARIRLGQPGGADGARAALTAAAETFPTHPEPRLALAELALFEGDQAGALLALDQALALDPHQPEVRRRRRTLSGQQGELEDRYSVDATAAAATPVSDAERRFGAAYLEDRKVVQLFENQKSARFQQFILRIQNPELAPALRAHQIPYTPSREVVEILDAVRIRPNREVIPAAEIRDEGPRGKVFGMYVDQRAKTIVFDDLAAGDVVHVRYRVDSVGDNIFGGFFGDVTAVQGSLPKARFMSRVITPRGLPLYSAEVRMPPPVAEDLPDGRALTWSAEDVPGLEVEPLSPPYPEIGRLVSVSTYKDWAELGSWYGRLFSEQLALDDAARAAGRAAVAGAATEAEKVRRLYEYVVKNTRYVGIELGIHGWKPFPAAEVHRRRYGDCKDKATLLAALLRDNGVDATITLVRTVDRGHLPKDHATMWAFNHAITYVPGLDRFLDPTAEFNAAGELPVLDQGAEALVVHPDGRVRLLELPISTPEDNLNASEYDATLSPDTRLVMEGRERFRGARAAELRQELEEPEQRRRHLEEPLAQILPGVKVDKASFSALEALEEEVWYRYRFTVPRYGRRDGPRLSVPVALFRHQVATAYAQLATRGTAIHLAHAWRTENEIRYHLPKGARLVTLPPGLVVDSPHIRLEQTVEATPDGFRSRDVVTLKSRVVPAADYPGFREACLAIDRAMERKVVIEW